jgi:hypothetical protein
MNALEHVFQIPLCMYDCLCCCCCFLLLCVVLELVAVRIPHRYDSEMFVFLYVLTIEVLNMEAIMFLRKVEM